MNSHPPAALSGNGRHARLGTVLVAILALVAYRPLLLSALRLPQGYEVSGWFFRPDQFSPLTVIAIAGWMLWRRRGRFRALPARGDAPLAGAVAAVGLGLFGWAQLTRSTDLLLPSLAAHVLAYATLVRGRAGCRVALLPAAVLLFGLPLPSPLGDELVWQLQLWTATGAGWVMETLGREVDPSGVVLRSGEWLFVVIDQCSGLRGIQLLTLVALVVRELFADSGARQWLLVLLAPLLGHALNVVRVAVVATSATPEALAGDADHTPQGLSALVVGTAVLYALGLALAAAGRGRSFDEPRTDGGDEGPAASHWPAATAWLAVLGVLSIATPAFPVEELGVAARLEFPTRGSGWSGEERKPDGQFVGALPWGQVVSRRYEKLDRRGRPQIVDLLIGFEVADNPVTTRLFSSKLTRPGNEWGIDDNGPTRLFLLGSDAELTIASNALSAEYAMVYTWQVRGDGFWRELSRSLLSLDAGPFRREQRRALVQLVTPLVADDPDTRDRAKQILDRFIVDFRDDLAAL